MKTPKFFAPLMLVAGLTVVSVATLADPMFGQQGQRGERHCSAERGAGPAGPGMMHGERMPPFLRGLDLTQEQRDKIFDITYAQMPAMRKQGEKLEDLRRQEMELTMSASYDAAKLKQLVDAQVKLQAQQQLAMAESRHQMYQLLTDEQRKELDQRKKPR